MNSIVFEESIDRIFADTENISYNVCIGLVNPLPDQTKPASLPGRIRTTAAAEWYSPSKTRGRVENHRVNYPGPACCGKWAADR